MDLDARPTPTDAVTTAWDARLHLERCAPQPTTVLARWSVTDPTTVRLVLLPDATDTTDATPPVELIVRRELLQTALSGPARTGGVRAEVRDGSLHVEVAGLRVELPTTDVATLLAASYGGAVRHPERALAR